MSRNKPAGENNLLALMRNHGSNKNKNRVTRKNEKKTKSQKNKKESSLGAEYDRKAREWAKRPQYKGDPSKLELVREPWEPRNNDEYYEREYLLDPKTGNYYDLDRIRLVARTRKGVIVPLKPIR
jgi:hypothetical protein